jgi:hypothetical protein
MFLFSATVISLGSQVCGSRSSIGFQSFHRGVTGSATVLS